MAAPGLLRRFADRQQQQSAPQRVSGSPFFAADVLDFPREASGGMGARAETDPLGPGQIRVPNLRPSPLAGMGNWASQLTSDHPQFPEMSELPSRSFDGEDHLDPAGMQQHLSNLLDDDDDGAATKMATTTEWPHSRGEMPTGGGPILVTEGCAPRDVVVQREQALPNLGTILTASKLFPPPPPPPDTEGPDPSSGLSRIVMHKRMMRWFQIAELWCAAEACTSDCMRAIVAPPPRPPPFADTHGIVVPTTGEPMHMPVSSIPAAYSFDRWMAQCRRWWAHVSHHFELLRAGGRFVAAEHVSTAPVELSDTRSLYQHCWGFQQATP
jgi:hypothetical protein